MTDLHRPDPVLGRAPPAARSLPSPAEAAERLLDGGSLVVTDHYRTGLRILGQLRAQLDAPADDAPYGARKAFREAFDDAARRLLVPIRQHAVDVPGAPRNGFVAELYPKRTAFLLRFVDLERMNNAWERYDAGVHLAVLGHRLHPFYGTYVPTRTAHLELFGTWLSAYDGPRQHAIDVGTGSGVLALMLCRAGFEQVVATDTNPNAVESVRRELARLDPPPPITPEHADLLGTQERRADLVVFNPPWTQGTAEGLLDRALVFEPGLFERFFDQAAQRLTPAGRIVLVFSNLIELVQPDVEHPIRAELRGTRFRLANKLQRKVKPLRTRDGRQRRTKERVEVWELARG